MAKLSFLQFVRSQRMPAPPLISADLTGQTVIVTGANIGLGLVAAKQFATMNPARLILACRSRDKGQAALEELKRETGYERAEVRILDLSRFASVSAFVDEFDKEDARVDVLLANAGVAMAKYEATSDGWESTLQVNHMSTALLCLLLLPRMIKTAREHNVTPRVTIVSSERHFAAKIDDNVFAQPHILRQLSDKDYCTTARMFDRYPLSKLLNVFFARALAEHLPPGSPVIVNSATPGFCYSSLRRNMPFLIGLFARVFELLLARSTETGASILVWAALAGTAGEISPALRDRQKGAYVSDWSVSEVSDFVLSERGKQSEHRIWEETIGILEQADPRVGVIVKEFLRGKN